MATDASRNWLLKKTIASDAPCVKKKKKTYKITMDTMDLKSVFMFRSTSVFCNSTVFLGIF
jgi:hypothetical protein